MKLYVFLATTDSRIYKITVFSGNLEDAIKWRNAAVATFLNTAPPNIEDDLPESVEIHMAADLTANRIFSSVGKPLHFFTPKETIQEVINKRQIQRTAHLFEIEVIKLQNIDFPEPEILAGMNIYNTHHGRRGSQSEVYFSIFGKDEQLIINQIYSKEELQIEKNVERVLAIAKNY